MTNWSLSAVGPKVSAVRSIGTVSQCRRFGTGERRFADVAILFLTMMCIGAISASATSIPIGFVSWDVTQPGAAAQFDIANETGQNSSLDPAFPVVVPVSFANLNMIVQFTDSSTRQFSLTDFTLNPFDGLSYESPSIPLGGFNPQPLSASLTGRFRDTTLTLYDGSAMTVLPDFTAQITGAGRPLVDGDLALIVAQTQGTQPPPPDVPEPSTLTLFGTATVLICSVKRVQRSNCASQPCGQPVQSPKQAPHS